MKKNRHIIIFVSIFLHFFIVWNGFCEDVPVSMENQKYIFSGKDADLKAVYSYYGRLTENVFPEKNPVHQYPVFEIQIQDDPSLNIKFKNLNYTLEMFKEEKHRSIFCFKSEEMEKGLFFIKKYVISGRHHTFDFIFEIKGEREEDFLSRHTFQILLNSNSKFITQPGADTFGRSPTLEEVLITGREIFNLSDMENYYGTTFDEKNWIGCRAKFWALLFKPINKTALISSNESNNRSEDTHTLRFKIHPYSANASFRFYAGPINWFAFGEEKSLSPLLYDQLWFWVRWISFALFFILEGLIRLTGCQGIAIILLSIFVKVAMLPLVRISDAAQKDVNEKKSRLKPYLDEIKLNYKGAEQNRKTLKIHKDLDIHPMFALKNFLGIFIQIPIFFAAYHTLGENVSLSGVSFLWIQNLAEPDHLFKLPFHIFYFGEYINILPFLMTGITLLTSWIFRDDSLSEDLLKKQRNNLYLMAFAFFILFYRFPSGMVLYWTTNNVLALIKAFMENNFRPVGTPEIP